MTKKEKRKNEKKKEAERRQTLFINHRTIGCGSVPFRRQFA